MAFATTLEPLWVFLDRLLCVIQPFKELKRGTVAARSSVNAKYTSLPPQLVILRALRGRHFLLAVVCGIAKLANLLSVALSGLFSEQLVGLEHEKLFTQARVHSISGPIAPNSNYYGFPTYSDHFYVTRANLADGIPFAAVGDQQAIFCAI